MQLRQSLHLFRDGLEPEEAVTFRQFDGHAGAQGQYAVAVRSTDFAVSHGESTLPMESEEVDTADFFTAATPGRFTVPATGVYLLVLVSSFANLSAASPRCVFFVRRADSAGTTIAYYESETYGAAGTYPGTPVVALVSLAAGDTLRFRVYQNSGATQTLTGSKTFASIARWA